MLTGGERLTDPAHAHGFYLAPTLIENVAPDAEISRSELFGPISLPLSRRRISTGALALANDSPYGLTACDPHANVHRAHDVLRRSSGAAWRSVNGGTYGSEPHMPFGGVQAVGQRLARAGHGGARRVQRA